MTSSEYLGQVRPGMCCTPIAMCNALRYWGLRSPEPDSPAWDVMVEIAACRHGATINEDRVAEWLGLVGCPTSLHFLRRGEHLPAMVCCRSPDGGLHAALVIDAREGCRPWAPDLLLVNYRYESGPLLEWLAWDEIAWADGNQDRSMMRWLVPRWTVVLANETWEIEGKLAAEYARERAKRRLVRD